MLRAIVVIFLFSTSALANPDAKQLAKDRVTAVDRLYQSAVAQLKGARGTVETVYKWSVRQLDAELDAGWLLKQALADHLKRMTTLAAELVKARDAGQVTPFDADSASYFRLEAEYWVVRGKR